MPRPPKKIDDTTIFSSDYHEEMRDLIEDQGLASLERLMLEARDEPDLYPELQLFKSAMRFEFIIAQLKDWAVVEQISEKYQVI